MSDQFTHTADEPRRTIVIENGKARDATPEEERGFAFLESAGRLRSQPRFSRIRGDTTWPEAISELARWAGIVGVCFAVAWCAGRM